MLTAVLSFSLIIFASAAPDSPEIVYLVSMPEPHTHTFRVEMEIGGLSNENLDLSMPVWTPGSYLVREYARHVVSFSARDGAGRPLSWRKVDKNTWRVAAGGAGEIRVVYEVYAREPGIRWSFVDSNHAHILGPNLFLFIDGMLSAPVTLKLSPPEGWRVSTGLVASPEDPFTFQVASYHELIDSPMEIGTHEELAFEVDGKVHVMAFYGRTDAELGKLRDGTRSIVEECGRLFGGLPYERFAFVVHFSPRGGGGLEHANGTTLGARSWGFADEERYERFFGLVAHEFFHTWNVKRIQPPAFKPYDYDRENYTDALWFSEGVTSYYTPLIDLRAGLISREKYLQRLAESIGRYRRTPGRLVQSAAESSFDTWIKFYRQDENSPNTEISYYTKGSIVGLLLDLEIARRTGGRKGLDDVVRLMWDETRRENRGFESADIRAVCEEVAGGSFERLFDEFVFGVRKVPFEDFLQYAGYKLVPDEEKMEKEQVGAYLGARLEQRDGRLVLGTVYSGSPAYRDGLNFGDEIVAVDEVRVGSPEELRTQLETREPGERVDFLVSRFGLMTKISVELGSFPAPILRIEEVEGPTEEQLTVRKAWLGEGDR